MSKTSQAIKLTLVRSLSKCLKSHKETIACLGLRKMHQTVEVSDNPCMRGMINKVAYLLKIEEL